MTQHTPHKTLSIAIVLSHFELSGVTTNTIDLCEGLTSIGHNVTLIVGSPNKQHQFEKAEYVESKGIRIIEIPDLHLGVLNKIRAFISLSKELIKGKYDSIHLESIYLSLIPKILHQKFTVTLHSWGLPKNIFAPRATRIIAISQGMKDEALHRHGYKDEDIDIVLHGVSERYSIPVSAKERNLLKSQFGIPTNKIVIGIVASVQPRKGHHYLLEAVSRLDPNKRDKIHIVFCGNPLSDDNEAWINTEINKFSLNAQVTRIAHTDPLNVYRCLDIFCLPSVWEGFPLVAIEAMLAGNCVLRSNVQGAAEQIQDGVTGFTFESENVSDLKLKLESLIDDPGLVQQIGKRGQEYALKHFTLRVMAENTAKVYLKLLKR